MLDLEQYYKKKDYESYIKCFNKYIEEGYGFDILDILNYIYSLIKTNRENYAYLIIKNFIKYNELSDNSKITLSSYLYFCAKPIDAIEVLENIETDCFNKNYYLSLSYMLAGRINESKSIIDKMLSNYKSAEEINRKLLNKINNYEKYGAFIETEYECFCNLGGKLEPGHIVYLEDSNKINNLSNCDYNYTNLRPYLIWKIKDGILYIYPVTTQNKQYRYKLSKSNYLNATYDRFVKMTLCKTDINNIKSVKDKLTVDDFNNIISFSVKNMVNNFDLTLSMKQLFYSLLNDNINSYEVIKVIDTNTRINKLIYYFVFEVNSEEYKCIKIDDRLNIISDEIIYLNKNDIIIYEKKVLDDFQKEKILNNIQSSMQIKLMRNI